MGARIPIIVSTDGDLDAAVEGVVAGGLLGFSGQKCLRVFRTIVETPFMTVFWSGREKGNAAGRRSGGERKYGAGVTAPRWIRFSPTRIGKGEGRVR